MVPGRGVVGHYIDRCIRLQGGESETELIDSSTAQAPPKNAIKIDVLLTDSDNRGS